MTIFTFQFGGEVAGFGSDSFEAVEHARIMGFEVQYDEVEMFGACGSRVDGQMYWTNDQEVIDELELKEFYTVATGETSLALLSAKTLYGGFFIA